MIGFERNNQTETANQTSGGQVVGSLEDSDAEPDPVICRSLLGVMIGVDSFHLAYEY